MARASLGGTHTHHLDSLMIGFLEGLKVTLKTAGRKPVTAEYPEPQKRLAVQDRYMGCLL